MIAASDSDDAPVEPIDLNLTHFVISVDGDPACATPTGTFPPVNKSSNSGEISDAMGGSTEAGTTDVTWIPQPAENNAAVAMLVSAPLRTF